ncbi:MAG: extracellular solute-binding protein [Proteobacteria bacterium]|nr:extracellular solute-binding protein [Pseudomonadota bacterium]NIS68384.1 extracellular solute-binding protein [Pseudomonadota bacterium]
MKAVENTWAARTGIFLLFFLIVLGGCQRDGTLEQKTIRFTTWDTPVSTRIYRDLIEEFESRNPDIRVELMMLPWTHYHRKILTMTAAGSKLDFMRLANSYFPQFVEKGALLPLDDYVKRDAKEIDLDDFYHEALMGTRADGRIYGLPLDIVGWAIYYNRGIFDKAGLPYPDESWTWETFFEVARKLTQDLDRDGIIDQYGAYVKVKMGVIELLAGQSGAMILNGDNSKCLFNSAEGRAVIQLLYDLIVKYRVVPPPETRASQDLFALQKVAMVLLMRGEVPRFRRNLVFDWDVGPVPKWPRTDPRALFVGGSNPWVISSSTKMPEQSWRFLRFFTGKEAAEKMVGTGRFVPARRSVAQSRAFLETGPPDHNVFFLDLIQTPNKVVVPRFQRYKRLEKVFEDNFQFLMEGKMSVESCVANIARDVDRLIEEVRSEEEERPS